MTAFQWFTIVQTVLMATAAALVAVIYRGFHTGRWIQKREDADDMIDARLTVIERRLDSGSERMSKLASDLNALPDRLRGIFLSIDVFHEVEKRNTEARSANREDIERIWQVIRGLQGGPRERDGGRL